MTLIHALPNLIAPLPGGHVALLTAWILVLLDRTCGAKVPERDRGLAARIRELAGDKLRVHGMHR